LTGKGDEGYKTEVCGVNLSKRTKNGRLAEREGRQGEENRGKEYLSRPITNNDKGGGKKVERASLKIDKKKRRKKEKKIKVEGKGGRQNDRKGKEKKKRGPTRSILIEGWQDKGVPSNKSPIIISPTEGRKKTRTQIAPY